MRSVPGLKSITICESPTTDEERITSIPGVPRSASSIGMVISSSTPRTSCRGLRSALRFGRGELGEYVDRHAAQFLGPEEDEDR